MILRGKPYNVAIMAIAKELAGFIWEMWYYVKKKYQLNRNFFYLTSTFEKSRFIII